MKFVHSDVICFHEIKDVYVRGMYAKFYNFRKFISIFKDF